MLFRSVFGADGIKGEEEVLESAIEAGALDVENDEEEGLVIWTEPEQMTAVADALSAALGAPPRGMELVFVAKDDMKTTDGGEPLEQLMTKLQDVPEMQMYLNTR